MRGLDLRVRIAQERVREVIHPEAAKQNENISSLLFEARALGVEDAENGQLHLPAMFIGEDELSHWWEDGQQSAMAYAEMRCCPSCTDRTGEPCRVHG